MMLRLNVCFAWAIGLLVAAGAQAGVLTFQEGVAGYTGTTDTTLTAFQPDNDWGGRDFFQVRGSSLPNHALVKFDNILGGGGGQIPPSVTSAEIANATLTVYNYIERGGSGAPQQAVWPFITSWVEGPGNNVLAGDDVSTWNHRLHQTDGDYTLPTTKWGTTTPTENAGPVFGEDTFGNLANPMDSFPSQARGDGVKNTTFNQVDFDVTGAVKAWIDGTYANEGFLVGMLDSPTTANIDLYYSHESITASGRPLLTVTIIPEPTTLSLLLVGAMLTIGIKRRNRL